MYKLNYYITEKKDVVFYKWFKTLKEATDFANALKTPELLLDIKYYNQDDPNQPHPPNMTI
jgi:hypothetical protein